MIEWSAVSWNELEPVLRKALPGLELTELEHSYRGGWVEVKRDPVDVTRDILNVLEAQGYFLVRIPNHEELGL